MKQVHSTRPLRVLLVEDDEDHAALTQLALARASRRSAVEHVWDGEEALARLRAQPDAPDVILLDLNLPRMSGHEVLAALEADAGLRAIPVIILTTSQADGDYARAEAAHVTSYLIKPLDVEAMYRALRLA